ncbi:MAG: DNA repair protein RecO, partial [Ferruginibacter sp.]
MTHKTKAIILRSIKYGEASLVVTAFTELFGIQTYLVNGVRASNKKTNNAACFQPSAILGMEVYHNELKKMHRIKEYGFAHLYQNILSSVIKYSVALFMVELLYKTLKQPENNPALFNFCEDAL